MYNDHTESTRQARLLAIVVRILFSVPFVRKAEISAFDRSWQTAGEESPSAGSGTHHGDGGGLEASERYEW